MWSLVTVSWVGSLQVQLTQRHGLLRGFKVWVKSFKSLTKVAEIQSHLACVSLTKSLQNEWDNMQSVVANLEKPFALLKTTNEHSFLTALFQSDVEQMESSLMM